MSTPHVDCIPHEARPYQGRPAGIVSRTAASVIDAVLICLIVVLGYAGLNGAVFLADPRGFQVVVVSWATIITAVFVVFVLYFSAAWSMTGRTYGCHVMGLRVVGSRGQRISLLVAVARAVLCALFLLGLFWCAFDRKSRSLQDLVLRTSVVYDWSPG